MHRTYARKALAAGLIAGTLDIAAAFIQYYLRTGKNPLGVLTFIASGVFGKKAFSGGYEMAAAGLLFHYIIALSFTFFFFWLASRIPSIVKTRIITGILFGIFIWAFMQFITLPLSGTPPVHFDLQRALVAAGILVVCIGLPVSYSAGRAIKVIQD